MANFRKSFNFRNGVQVDEDNFIVNSAGLVGIGTSVPTEFLDVRGSLKVVGVATIQDAFIGVATVTNQFEVGITSFSSGIIAAKTGIVTYYGDARFLQGMPTSQWVDTDVGLGYTSIYSAGNVGVGTTDPRFTLQIGGNNDTSNFSRGVGISSVGDVNIAGIATIAKFYGYGIGVTGLNAGDAIATGTLHNDRLPSNINKPTGIVTANSIIASSFTGPVTGTATTATSLSGTPDIEVGIVTATKIIADTVEVPNTGITTISKLLHVGTGGTALSVLDSGRLGVGTAIPSAELQIIKQSGSLVEVISEQGQSRISIGQSVGVGNSTGILRFGNSDNVFEVINNATGNFKNIIHGSGVGINTGNFQWIYGKTNSELMTLTYDGKLGINNSSPQRTLDIVGTSTVTGDAYVGGDLTVGGNINFPAVIDGANLNVTSGVTTVSELKVTNTVDFTAEGVTVGLGTAVGVGTFNPTSGFGLDVKSGATISYLDVTSGINANSGIVTALDFVASGGFRSATSSNAVEIEVLSSPNRIFFNVVGIGSTTLQLF